MVLLIFFLSRVVKRSLLFPMDFSGSGEYGPCSQKVSNADTFLRGANIFFFFFFSKTSPGRKNKTTLCFERCWPEFLQEHLHSQGSHSIFQCFKTHPIAFPLAVPSSPCSSGLMHPTFSTHDFVNKIFCLNKESSQIPKCY